MAASRTAEESKIKNTIMNLPVSPMMIYLNKYAYDIMCCFTAKLYYWNYSFRPNELEMLDSISNCWFLLFVFVYFFLWNCDFVSRSLACTAHAQYTGKRHAKTWSMIWPLNIMERSMLLTAQHFDNNSQRNMQPHVDRYTETKQNYFHDVWKHDWMHGK